ncbi:hypothetical protein ERICIV_02481 [Paenibacillus larvae subsp. larvae]|uniref:Uncharacterized protein n=2 Tax=Paenibacillus larvae TaxID=1464 RepID=A0A6C0QMX2_9BACL|nr:hypothetical protein [Paenibacillus larvae]QHZ54132.1 hypothetical protein ERICV_05148 [Paenibacillus phage phiERICV]AQT83476.1 hypothetical protein B1222_01930 [Paenibacillus larvae subsp. pulvifaciens]AQZ48577.1 hypothetical protein B5S25_20365 [Paenibacillus larvae subsp. pulvifaciens]ARF70103.1 hypothetical protein B7C51_23035 [Paenibacillus larvae subsp. pulvifaciens]AVF31389.1 hypothetical protein ERICIV_02481 [Paenibacillus larvae subsp. larvae]
MEYEYIPKPNNILSKEEYLEKFQTFLEESSRNPDIIWEVVSDTMASLDKDFKPNATTLAIFKEILPAFLSKESIDFLRYILRNGLQNIDEMNKINTKLTTKLHLLVLKNGINFRCAENYLANPMAYALLQTWFSSLDKEALYMQILRADKESLNLRLDVHSMYAFTRHLIEKLIQLLETHDIPEESQLQLVDRMFSYLVKSGVITKHE